MYIMKVTGVKESIFLIKIHRKKVDYTVIEGEPQYIFLSEEEEVIEFENKIASKFINVLVEELQ